MKQGFWSAGHNATLFSALLYFDISFMVWIMMGPLAIQIASDLYLTPSQKGLMVAVPVLSGAILRIFMGILVDQLGPKMAGIVGQVIVIISLFFAWSLGIQTFEHILILGIFLGFAGASFAVALPLASRWYPPRHQGTALGIVGAVILGPALASLFAPSIALAYGWNNVFGLVLIPLTIVFLLYLYFAKDAPNIIAPKKLSEYIGVLRDEDAWWFMFFYSVTFGGFVGLASSLPVYFNDMYALSPVHAGYFTAICIFAGSLMRPFGGRLADKQGGIRTLTVMYILAGLFLALLSIGVENQFVGLVISIILMIVFGMGNGAVFQLVPQRFRKEIGIMTGLVGMAGGVGGFYLSSSLGYSKELTGHYSIGMLFFSGLIFLALFGLMTVKKRWRTTWGSALVTSAKV
jgi:NNP family nitrate/nitrite transporter-like MFS transporter